VLNSKLLSNYSSELYALKAKTGDGTSYLSWMKAVENHFGNFASTFSGSRTATGMLAKKHQRYLYEYLGTSNVPIHSILTVVFTE
jgi:hypothetical protein